MPTYRWYLKIILNIRSYVLMPILVLIVSFIWLFMNMFDLAILGKQWYKKDLKKTNITDKGCVSNWKLRKLSKGSYKLQLKRARNIDDKEETGSSGHKGRTTHKNLQEFVTESKHVSSMRMITVQALVSSVMCMHMISEKMLGKLGMVLWYIWMFI